MAGEGTSSDRRILVDQAVLLLESLFVHLPLKRALHGVDPVRRMKLVRSRGREMSEGDFRLALMSAFLSAQDLHTVYFTTQTATEPVAILPFRLEKCFEEGNPTYVVTALEFGFTHPQFVPGVNVTHWNGVPIARAIDQVAGMTAAGNDDARAARGLANLTQRPLRFMAPPVEEWVVLTYQAGDVRQDIRFVWRVIDVPTSPVVRDDTDRPPEQAPRAATRGLDVLVDVQRRAREVVLAPQSREGRPVREGRTPLAGVEVAKALRPFLQVGVVAHGQRDVVHLRIPTFEVPDVDAFVAEVHRIVTLLPANGLIIDVRGNPGGAIAASERLLQLFTPRMVDPERFHFLNTPLTLELAERVPWLSDWKPSIHEANDIGAVYSDGFPIEQGHAARCNAIGQVYFGPLVLIVDALCYSAADVFAAGFQDHGIGPVLGTDGTTGGGGANAWDHGFLASLLDPGHSPVEPLPAGSQMSVAVRQARRVGLHTGTVLEDRGVRPDVIHRPTRKDLLEEDVDLLARAADMVSSHPTRFDVTVDLVEPADCRLILKMEGVDRVDVAVDDRPRVSIDVSGDSATISLALAGAGPWSLGLSGYFEGRPVARRSLLVEPRS